MMTTRTLASAFRSAGKVHAAVLALAAALLALALLPGLALADDEPGQEAAQGTVYISVSRDGRYMVSDGDISGQVMAHVPVDLAEVSAIDLADYGLDGYGRDLNGDGDYDPTLLKLFAYVSDNYTSSRMLTFEGLFMVEFGNYSFKLNPESPDYVPHGSFSYYANGEFPLQAGSTDTGATCDEVVLADGGFYDLVAYSEEIFYKATNAGYHYFYNRRGNLTFAYSAEAGKPVKVTLQRAWGDLDRGIMSLVTPEAGYGVCSSTSFESAYIGAPDAPEVQVATTGSDGTVAITFDEPGTYYLWADGSAGVWPDGEFDPGEEPDTAVNSPAYAVVTVIPAGTPIDKEGLKELCDQAATLVLGTKTSATGNDVLPSAYWATQAAKNALIAARASGMELYEDDEAIAPEVEDAKDSVSAAITAFGKARKKGATPDTASLKKEIAAAKSDANSTKVSSKSGADIAKGTLWATSAAKTTLLKAVTAAQGVLDQAAAGKATKAQASSALTTLKAAHAKFDKAKKDGKLSKPAFSTKSLPAGKAKASYTATVAASGSPTYAASGLPKGLSIAAKTGKITGKPTVAGTFTVKVTAKNAAGSVSKSFKLTVATADKGWKRVAGLQRFATAQLVSQEAFAKGSSTWAVVADGAGYADALAAAGLAGARKCPVVLVWGARPALNDEARAELKRLGVKNVYIMGGYGSVSTGVESDIKAMKIKTTRLAGANRVETSVMAAQNARKAGSKSDTVIVTTLADYPDTLSISPWSYANAAPVLLSWTDGLLNPSGLAEVKAGKYKKAVVVATDGVVKKGVEKQLKGVGVKTVTWLEGKTPYATNAAVVKWELKNGMTAEYPIVATANGFADALGGSALAGSKRSVIVLADSATAPGIKILASNKAARAQGYILGGEGTISAQLAKQVSTATGAGGAVRA